MNRLTKKQKERLHKLQAFFICETVAQDDRWVTVKPNGAENKGSPVKIDDEGRIVAGMGGKFKGQKINEIRKSFNGPKTPSSETLNKNKEEQKKSTSKRLERLQSSLEKKNQKFDSMLKNHFAAVNAANGQPLNDKRNGQAILRRWEKQGNALTRQLESVEKTERAIEREKNAIARVESVNLPSAINEAIQSGELTQWRKFPNRFFVKGVEKGRIIWDEKKGQLLNSHYSEVPEEQKPIFKKAFYDLKEKLAGYTQELAEKKKDIPKSAYFDPSDIEDLVEAKKLGAKFSYSKQAYFFPAGIEMPEKFNKYVIESASNKKNASQGNSLSWKKRSDGYGRALHESSNGALVHSYNGKDFTVYTSNQQIGQGGVKTFQSLKEAKEYVASNEFEEIALAHANEAAEKRKERLQRGNTPVYESDKSKGFDLELDVQGHKPIKQRIFVPHKYLDSNNNIDEKFLERKISELNSTKYKGGINGVLSDVGTFSSPVTEKQGATYLNVPYANKDEAKALGAKWDSVKKKWYMPDGLAVPEALKKYTGDSFSHKERLDTLYQKMVKK